MTNNVPKIDHIQEVFTDLCTLGIIIEELQDDTLKLNLKRLNMLGYCLVFNGCQPVFTILSDFNYMYNCNIYSSDVIPRSSLASFLLLNIKNCKLSP